MSIEVAYDDPISSAIEAKVVEMLRPLVAEVVAEARRAAEEQKQREDQQGECE